MKICWSYFACTVKSDLENLSKINGIEHIAMTTNGIAVRRKLEILAESGLRGINISLDTLDPERYLEVTRRKGLSEVLKTIDLASSIFDCVKVGFYMFHLWNHGTLPR